MESAILKKVQNISSEINEMHPLLRALFDRMDGIQHVEYTHGNREFGADFVLRKNDALLGDIDNVGIIAKVQSITQGNNEVSRQIDECITMPRIILGSKKVIINEIWVITCGTISTNAKDFFSEKFQSSKLKFIDKTRLTKLIDKNIKDYWKDISIGASMYLSKTQDRLSAIEKSSSFSIANLEGYEIEQDLVKINRSEYKKEKGRKTQKQHRTTLENLITKSSVTLIEGRMGSGKSNLLRKCAISHCNIDVFIEDKTLPIYNVKRARKQL